MDNQEFELLKQQMAEVIARNKKLEEENKKFHDEIQAIKDEHKEPEPVVEPVKKTFKLISEAKIRCFYVDPRHVIRVIRGTQNMQILKDSALMITPGSIVEVDEELAKFLLTYKTFKVYGE
jgi:regulator of replication initiation timing